MHLKNSPAAFLIKVLGLYAGQVISETLIRGRNRKTHLAVLASFLQKLPRFIAKRWQVRVLLKREGDSRVLLRLTKARPRLRASAVKRICVYNAYLPTMGGGENLTAHTIAYFNQMFPLASIDILCHATAIYERTKFTSQNLVEVLERECDVPLRNTNLRIADVDLRQKGYLGLFRDLRRLSSITSEYDLFVNNTYGSVLPARARVNIYSCMFPSRLEVSGSLLRRALGGLLHRSFLTSYHLFLAISHYTQKWIDRYWKVNSYVLYPPVRAPARPLGLRKENIVLNVGRFFISGHSKKQDVMVKAFRQMCDNGSAGAWKLVLVGRRHADEDSSRYTEALERLAVGYPIELRYDMGFDELQEWLQRARIYWHATGYGEKPDESPEKAEHFGLSTIDAAQAGAVPVVFNAGGQPEIIEHAKNGFLWNTDQELIEYTQRLMSDDALWQDLSIAARGSMAIFGIDTQLRWFKLFLGQYFDFN
jgi:glycosyltransferase involved in cell wall biosynthesis